MRIWPCCLKAISIPTGPQSCPYSLQLDHLKAKLFQPFGHGFEQLPVQPAGLWPVQVLKYAPLTPPAHCVQTPHAPPAPRASPPTPISVGFDIRPVAQTPQTPPAALPGDPARVPAGWRAQPSITAPATSLSDRKQLAPSKRRSSDKHSLGNNKVAK